MIPLILTFGDGAFEHSMKDKEVIHLGNDSPPIHVAVLDKGMSSGRPSVAFGIDIGDGKFVIAETSARLFVSASNAIMARYPDLLKDN